MSTVVKYVASGTNVVNPAARSPATSRSRLAARSSGEPGEERVGQVEPDGDRRLERRAVHVGQELLGGLGRGRPARAGPHIQPIFHPVVLNVLPPDEIVSVRSAMPGSVAIGTWAAPGNTRCS